MAPDNSITYPRPGRPAYPAARAASRLSAPTPQVEADVEVRIAPPVRPHIVDRKTDGIRIGGERSGTTKAIHPVQRGFKNDTDRHDFDIMSCETTDMPLGSVCACRAQR